ncbi:hypothetical protein NBRC116187_10080 [Halopseudomonas sabulinigri]|uniref:Uncharacterized protein n=1 Tax=Halopseudomonas sabulinigri TaxID=472181 RepID=A0ABP9ZME2_9GAMM
MTETGSAVLKNSDPRGFRGVSDQGVVHFVRESPEALCHRASSGILGDCFLKGVTLQHPSLSDSVSLV